MAQVLENPWIRDVKHLPDIFTKSVWSFQGAHLVSNYYRPLMNILYLINHHLFGLAPWGFHLVNVLFHAANSVLVFFVTARLLESRASDPTAPFASPTVASFLSPPFVAAYLFATHPVHTEAVTWVAGLPDLSFAFFFLLSFHLYVRSSGEKPPLPWSYPLSVVSFFLATLCKEPALTLPVILMGFDSLVRKDPGGFLVRFRRYLPYFGAAGIYLILRIHALGGMAPSVRRHAYLNAWQYVVNAFPLFTQYLEKLLLPVTLNAFHVFHPISSFLDPKGIVALAVTIAFLLLAFLFMKRDRLIVFGLLWIAVPLLPALYIPSLGENTFAERYLYLPSYGFVLLVSLALPRLMKTSRSAALAAFLLAALVVLYAGWNRREKSRVEGQLHPVYRHREEVSGRLNRAQHARDRFGDHGEESRSDEPFSNRGDTGSGQCERPIQPRLRVSGVGRTAEGHRAPRGFGQDRSVQWTLSQQPRVCAFPSRRGPCKLRSDRRGAGTFPGGGAVSTRGCRLSQPAGHRLRPERPLR